MPSLMFLSCFDQKLSKKNLWGVDSTPLGKGKVSSLNMGNNGYLKTHIYIVLILAVINHVYFCSKCKWDYHTALVLYNFKGTL